MKSFLFFGVLLHMMIATNFSIAQNNLPMTIPFEQNNLHSADYYQTIKFYQELSQQSDFVHMIEAGSSDIGKPIHLVIINNENIQSVEDINRTEKSLLFINNGIHPGEPCGIDASMMLVRDLIQKPSLNSLLDHTVIILIPIYNISGALNRGSYSRANQNGPTQYGFRGNIQHLDLNRDFIKTKTKNAQTFNRVMSSWQPDMMIDNHTSNGADYQYTMTLIPTQKDKLEPSLKEILTKDIIPYLYDGMQEKKWDMTPYVFAREKPDDGIMGFLDLARYSSGYAALHQCIAFMPETHMLKPFKDRVESTYDFMITALEYLAKNGKKLRKAKKEAIDYNMKSTKQNLHWKLDIDKVDKLLFKGYEAKYKKSDIHGKDRLYYDRAQPFEKEINFLNSYKVTNTVFKPKAYIIPQAFTEVIEKLQNNNVVMQRMMEDKVLSVNQYKIINLKTTKEPYEGRYLHSDISTELIPSEKQYFKGDYIIYTGQRADRYIMETLEPEAPDSYFAWGFFDGILMQKEYFSPYVFEDLAVEILKDNPTLKQTFEDKKQSDQAFSEDAYGQLLYIYQHSIYFEDTYRIYPITRLEKD